MYCVDDIERLKADIAKFRLSAPVGMFETPNDELCKICNGVGCNHPEHVPSALKKVLNRVMSFAQCSAAIHDYNYYNSDGTEAARESVDKQFRANMLDEINGRVGRFKWLKQWLALRAFEAVRRCGRSDWCIAFAEKTIREKMEGK